MSLQPKVSLLSSTERPIETINAVWQASRDNEPVDLNNGDPDLFQKVIDSKIPVAEMIDFVFLLENVSIAFREQMVRHRIGVKVGDRLGVDHVPDLADSTWWSQSMRVLDMGSFASAKAYETPEAVKNSKGAWVDDYNKHMQRTEELYNNLLSAGVPAEDARMILPLACQHRIVWKLNLAALMHIVSKRSCWILQLGFWGPVIRGMIQELAYGIDPIFARLATPPCMRGDKFNECLFHLDNEKRMKGEDPLPPCPLWMNQHRDRSRAAEEAGAVWTLDTQGHASHLGDHAKNATYNSMVCTYNDFWYRDVRSGRPAHESV